MRAVTAGGDAVGIATTIDPEAPKARRFGGLFAGAFSAAAMRAASAWRIAAWHHAGIEPRLRSGV
jgi:hypothetical protein